MIKPQFILVSEGECTDYAVLVQFEVEILGDFTKFRFAEEECCFLIWVQNLIACLRVQIWQQFDDLGRLLFNLSASTLQGSSSLTFIDACPPSACFPAVFGKLVSDFINRFALTIAV